jgi:hypothetical protein
MRTPISRHVDGCFPTWRVRWLCASLMRVRADGRWLLWTSARDFRCQCEELWRLRVTHCCGLSGFHVSCGTCRAAILCGACVDRTVDYWHVASVSFAALCNPCMRVRGMLGACQPVASVYGSMLGFAAANLFVAIFARGHMGRPRRPDRSISLAWRVQWQSRIRSNGVYGSQRGFRGGALRYYVIASSPRCARGRCMYCRSIGGRCWCYFTQLKASS